MILLELSCTVKRTSKYINMSFLIHHYLHVDDRLHKAVKCALSDQENHSMEEVQGIVFGDLETKTKNSIDTFVCYAEALSLPIKNNRAGSILEVSKIVMKEVTSREYEADELFKALEYVILELVSEARERGIQCNLKHLPKLTRRQKEALSLKYRTFHGEEKLLFARNALDLYDKMATHKELVELTIQLGEKREKCSKAKKYLEEELKTKLQFNPSCYKNEADLHEKLIEDIHSLQMSISKLGKELSSSSEDFEKALEDEKSKRDTLLQTACTLRATLLSRLCYSLANGMSSLESIIEEFLPHPSKERCITILKKLNLTMTAANLMDKSSKKYIFPILFNGVEFESLKQPMMIDSIYHYIPSSLLGQPLNVKVPTEEWNKKYQTKPRLYKLILKPSREYHCPGFLTLSKGVKVMKLSTVDHDIWYGTKSCRWFRHNRYGFVWA